MAIVSSSNGIEKYPKLRFKAFSEKWKDVKFYDLFTYVSNNTLSRAELNYEIGQYQNIHYGDVLIKFGPFVDANTNTLPFINLAAEKNFDNMLLQDGDIIIADTAEDETVGKATEIINTGNRKIVSGLHTIACRPKIKMIPTYLGFYFNSEAYHKQLYSLMQGIKVLSISKSNIETTIIKYPCIGEQAKICSMLYLIEKRIAKQQQLIEHLKKYKRGVLQKLFSANKYNWKKARFGDFFTEHTEKTADTKTYPICSLTIEDGVILKPEKYFREFLITKEGESYKILRPSWFAYNPMNAHIGAIAPNTTGIAVSVSGYYNIFSVNQPETTTFWEEYLKCYNMLCYYKVIATGSLIEKQRVHYSQFVNIEMPLPSIKEQEQISLLLRSLNNKLKNAECIYNNLLKQKSGFLQKLFI